MRHGIHPVSSRHSSQRRHVLQTGEKTASHPNGVDRTPSRPVSRCQQHRDGPFASQEHGTGRGSPVVRSHIGRIKHNSRKVSAAIVEHSGNRVPGAFAWKIEKRISAPNVFLEKLLCSPDKNEKHFTQKIICIRCMRPLRNPLREARTVEVGSKPSTHLALLCPTWS